jgi:hypothetical protein
MHPVARRALLPFAVFATAHCVPAESAWPSDSGPADASTPSEAAASPVADSATPSPRDSAMETTPALDSSGGAVDDVASDATEDAQEAGSACAGVFCEDFELGMVDPSRWDVQMTGGATVTIQSQTVAHGKYAAQFHSLGPSGGSPQDYAYIIASSVPASLHVHNFGRAYFYANPKMTSVDTGLIWGGTSGFPRPTYLSLAAHNGGWQFGFIQLMGSPGGEVQSYPATPMPVAAWTCIEWEFNDQPDTINVWGDGTVIGTLDNNHIDYPPGHTPGTPLFNNQNSGLIGAFTDFGFGFYDWHPGGVAFDFYYDDIVLDTKRVGCL